jgi:hypothetical protein
MANWAKLQEDTVGLPVYKRAKHGIHFDKGHGEVLANFVGKPCHFQDGGIWKAIDTKLLLGGDGFYGCPHSPVRIHKDGHVKINGTNYQQYTELPSATGLVDNDRIVRTFSFGEQRMWVTEDGYHSEIQLNRIPTLAEARKVITSESGTLSKSYLKSLTTATDANGAVHTVTTLSAFRTWLASAVFPVVIDPDFAGIATDEWITGYDAADYAVARSTKDERGGVTSNLYIGQNKGAAGPTLFQVWRAYIAFDTSSIGATSTVTQDNMKLTVLADNSTVDFDVQIAKYDWSAWNGGSDSAKMEVAYDGCLAADADDSIWRNTNGISQNTQYTSGNLSTAWVSKTGTTYYGLRSSRDVAATEPAGAEHIRVCSANHATESYRPVLTVLYTGAGTFIPINMNAQMQNLTGGMRG